MATILNFRVNFLLVNCKIWKWSVCKIVQTQKGVNFTVSKTYPYITPSNDTNNLAVFAVCKNVILMTPFPAPGNTVWRYTVTNGHRTLKSHIKILHEQDIFHWENINVQSVTKDFLVLIIWMPTLPLSIRKSKEMKMSRIVCHSKSNFFYFF